MTDIAVYMPLEGSRKLYFQTVLSGLPSCTGSPAPASDFAQPAPCKKSVPAD